MKTALKLSALMTVAGTQIALAHPGAHGDMGAAEMANHVSTSPFHVALIIIPGLALVGMGFALHRARAEKRLSAEMADQKHRKLSD